METNNAEIIQRFPELKDPVHTLTRIAEAFVAPEYARAGFALMRRLARKYGETAGFGLNTVVTAPHEYDTLIMTVSKWWFFNFHIAPAEALEEGEDVEELVPLDYQTVLERQRDDDSGNTNGNGNGAVSDAEVGDDNDSIDYDEEEDEDDDEIVEATFYQVGTFLLDSTIIPHEEIFDREDFDCYAYDYPEERIEAERFYWARMVWEPEDLQNEDLLAAIDSTAEFLYAQYGTDTPYAEFHDSDFAQLILDESLCERAIGATDFGDVIVVEGGEEE